MVTTTGETIEGLLDQLEAHTVTVVVDLELLDLYLRHRPDDVPRLLTTEQFTRLSRILGEVGLRGGRILSRDVRRTHESESGR